MIIELMCMIDRTNVFIDVDGSPEGWITECMIALR